MADRAPPTPLAMIIGTAIISLMFGYMVGMGSSLGIFPNPFNTKLPKGRGVEYYDDEEESAEEDVDESILDHAPNWGNGFEADQRDGLRVKPAGTNENKKEKKVKGKEEPQKRQEWEAGEEKTRADWEDKNREECKLVLVVRTDLNMTKGKIAAQCGHATLACYKNFMRNDPKSPVLRRWENDGQAKIALRIGGEDELQELQAKAMSLGLVAEVIQDAGRTQIEAGSRTVLGIGPGPKSIIDKVTKELKLL